MNNPRMLTRCGRFLVAGAPGFVVQMVTLAGLMRLAGMHYVMATSIAVEAAILCNFIWHERWTWRDRPSGGAREQWSRLLRFNALTGLTSIAGTVALTATLVASSGISPLTANAIAVVLLGLLNFAAADVLVFRTAAVLAFAAVAADARAATLQPKTAEGFARYSAAVEARSARQIQSHFPLKQGAVVGGAIEVPGGIINHWRGAIFIPNLRLDTLLQRLKNPGNDLLRQEDVVRYRVLSRRGSDELAIYLRLKRTQGLTVVYDTEHDVRYRVIGPGRAVSSSIATRIVEVEDAETPNERCRPAGDDQGFLWRLNSYWRYEQAGGGVLVELESLTLSRDIPSIFKPIVLPIIERVARESMTRTLASLRSRFTS